MPPVAIAGGIAAVGAISGSIGGKKAAKKQRQYQKQAAKMLSPQAIRDRIIALNPKLAAAAYGQSPFANDKVPTNLSQWLDYESGKSGRFQDPYQQLYQAPGYIDPRAMNYNLQQVDQDSARNMQNARSLLGRAAYSGGMANAYALANQAGRTSARAGVFKDYNLAREQMKRSDIELGQNLLMNQQNIATEQARAAAGYIGNQQVGGNIYSTIGEGIGTGLNAYGAFKSMGLGGGKDKTTFKPATSGGQGYDVFGKNGSMQYALSDASQYTNNQFYRTPFQSPYPTSPYGN